MIDAMTRQNAIDLILEAEQSGAHREKACEVLDLPCRTFRRWLKRQQEQSLVDRRKAAAVLRTPANKLSKESREQIVAVCNQPEYQSLAPTQIVPRLADKGLYIASESSFYRVLKEVDQVQRRGRAKSPRTVTKPKGYKLK